MCVKDNKALFEILKKQPIDIKQIDIKGKVHLIASKFLANSISPIEFALSPIVLSPYS